MPSSQARKSWVLDSCDLFSFIACPFCQETGGEFSQLSRELAKASIQFFISAIGSTGVPAAVSQAAVKTAAISRAAMSSQAFRLRGY